MQVVAIALFSLITVLVGAYLVWSGGITSLNQTVPGALILFGSACGLIRLGFALKQSKAKILVTTVGVSGKKLDIVQAAPDFNPKSIFVALQTTVNRNDFLSVFPIGHYTTFLNYLFSLKEEDLAASGKQVFIDTLKFYLRSSHEISLEEEKIRKTLKLIDAVLEKDFTPKTLLLLKKCDVPIALEGCPKVLRAYLEAFPQEKDSLYQIKDLGCKKVLIAFQFEKEDSSEGALKYFSENISLVVEWYSKSQCSDYLLNIFNKWDLKAKQTFLKGLSEPKSIEFLTRAIVLFDSPDFISATAPYFTIVAEITTIDILSSNSNFYFSFYEALSLENSSAFFSALQSKKIEDVQVIKNSPRKKLKRLSTKKVEYDNFSISHLYHLIRLRLVSYALQKEPSFSKFNADRIWTSPLPIDGIFLNIICQNSELIPVLPYICFKAFQNNKDHLKSINIDSFRKYYFSFKECTYHNLNEVKSIIDSDGRSKKFKKKK